MCRVLKTVRLRHIHSSISCLVATSLACLSVVLLFGPEEESGIPCIDPGGGGWFSSNGCTVLAHKRDIQRVQRSLTAYNHRNGKNRTVRVGRDFQNCSMHNVLEYTQKEGTFYCTSGVCLVLSPEQTLDRDTDPNNGSMTTDKQKTQKVDSEEESTRLYCAPIAHWPTTSRIPMESWMCRRILFIPGLSVKCWCELHCNMTRKSKVSQHVRLEVPKPKNSARCRNETIFKLAARSLVVLGHKEGRENTTVFRSRKEMDKYRSRRSCDQTCDGEVRIIEQFMDRRHHFHLRQPGMNLMSGKNDSTSTDHEIGKNEYSFSESWAALQVFAHSKMCFIHFAYRHPRMSCTRRGVQTEHLVRAPQTHIFYLVLAHVTVAHHLPTSRRCLKNELSLRVCVFFRSHLIVTCFVSTCFVFLILSLRFYPRHLWHSLHRRLEYVILAPIHGAVNCLA